MSLSAAALQLLLDKGLTLADVVEFASVLEADAAPAPVADPREAKRAYDRERMRAKRDVARQSYDIADDIVSDAATAPPSPSFSPQTPQNHPHPPVDITTREGVSAKASQLRLAKPNGFAAFWEAYPRKIGKVAAEKAFDRAFRSITAADPLAVILAGLERAKASRAFADPEFIPHPTTWLNQGRWDDQPTEIIQFHPQGRPHEFAHPRQAATGARNDRLSRSLAGLMAAVDERTSGLD